MHYSISVIDLRSAGQDYTFTKSISDDPDHWFRSDVRNQPDTAGNLFLLYTCAEHRLLSTGIK